MSLHVIEGTWEEIERHRTELIGHRFRLTPLSDTEILRRPEAPTLHTQSAAANAPAQAKILRARGAFKGMFGGTEALLAEKQAEIELEELGNELPG